MACLQSLNVGSRLLRRHRTKKTANLGIWMTVSIVPLTSASFCFLWILEQHRNKTAR